MPSWIASSFSHGDAFISSNGERTITFTSLPPRRLELRQQSIAVLPPPSTMTRLPIRVTWPNETDDSQSMPMWMLRRGLAAAGDRRGRGRAARPSRRRPRPSFRRAARCIESMRVPPRNSTPSLQHVAGLLVDHLLGQAKARDLRADHAAGLGVAVEHDDLVAERRQVARDRQRCGPGADAGDALAVLRADDARQLLGDVVLVVGRDALQAADRDRLGLRGLRFLDPAAPAGRLAGPVAGAAEDAREDVRFPVDQVGVGVAAGRDQADVFGNGGVGGAGPLAVDYFVEVVGIVNIGGLQRVLSCRSIPAQQRRRLRRERNASPVAASCQQGFARGPSSDHHRRRRAVHRHDRPRHVARARRREEHHRVGDCPRAARCARAAARLGLRAAPPPCSCCAAGLRPPGLRPCGRSA